MNARRQQSKRVVSSSSWTILSILLISLLQFLLLSPVTQAAHARKRPVLQVRSSNPYDKQITTFDADGHIMQLQYAQKAVNKGSSALFLHHNNHIVAVLQSTTTSSGTNSGTSSVTSGTSSGTSSSNVKHRENKSLFRINHGILAKMTGLQGDSRLLAKYLMQRALELDWKEGLLLSQELPLRIQQIANACAEVQHSLTTKPGARPLAVEAVLLGIDGIMDIDMDMDIEFKGNDSARISRHKLGLYKCHLTGVVNQCQYCIVGNIVDDKMLYNECKEEMESSLHADAKEMTSVNTTNAQHHAVIAAKRMAKLLLKHQLQRQEQYTHGKKDESDNPQDGQLQDPSPAVDIYIITPNSKCRGGMQITCATCVGEDEIDRVGQLLQNANQR